MDVITSHENADFDCLGAMIAAKRLYPEAELVFSGARERNLREFFLNTASYAFNFKRIKEIDLDAIRRLILVDVRQADRIGPFGAVALRPDVEVHIYDHHPGGEDNLQGDQQWIEPYGSSVTVMTHLFIERGIVPTADEATVMMLGLYEDTGCLTFNSTGEKDYEAAAFLLTHGANLNTVSDCLTQELTAAQVALLNELITNRVPIEVDGVRVMMSQASLDHYVGDLATLVHKLKDMENDDALLVAVRMGDRVFLVGRSRIPEVDVGAILRPFGGGGHDYAASATIKEMPLAQVVERLQRAIQQQVRSIDVARTLMSYPPKTVAQEASVAEVRDFLTRYNINACPVLHQGRLIGVVSRQQVERAAHHRLDEMAVEEVMSRDYAVAQPDTAVRQLQNLIVGHGQRCVPIVDGKTLVGVVTRSDLLRHMVQAADESGDLPPVVEPVLKRRYLARMIESDLPQPIVAMLKQFGQVAEQLGVHAYLVGGFVRDLMLRRKNLDIDLVIEGDGIRFAETFAQQQGCRVRSHRKFHTAVIIFPDGFKVDVASARMEFYAEPGALPTVEYSSIKLDLFRRDFTINTLAISLDATRFGELLDFFGGLRDLRNKTLRVLHNLSFVEDPTRVFRAIRFEQRLGFHLGAQTEFLLTSAVNRGFLGRLGGPRVLNEIKAIFSEEDPLPAIERMASLELLRFLHEALELNDEMKALFESVQRALHWFDLLYTGERCDVWLIYLLGLTWTLPDAETHTLTKRLGLTTQQTTLLVDQAADGRRLLGQMAHGERSGRAMPPSFLYRHLHTASLELLLMLVAAAPSDSARRLLSQFLIEGRHRQPLLNGDDLKQMGIPPGPDFRRLLDQLLEAQLDGEVTSREQGLTFVQSRFKRLRRGKKDS